MRHIIIHNTHTPDRVIKSTYLDILQMIIKNTYASTVQSTSFSFNVLFEYAHFCYWSDVLLL